MRTVRVGIMIGVCALVAACGSSAHPSRRPKGRGSRHRPATSTNHRNHSPPRRVDQHVRDRARRVTHGARNRCSRDERARGGLESDTAFDREAREVPSHLHKQ